MTKVCIYSPINILLQVHPIQSRKFPNQNTTERESVILYIGLGLVAVGLVITFVGLGEKGFKSIELKLVGPSLVTCGLFLVFLQILYCTLPLSVCGKSNARKDEAEKLLINEEMLSDIKLKPEAKNNGLETHNFDLVNHIFVQPENSEEILENSSVMTKMHQKTFLKVARQKLASSYSDDVFLDNISSGRQQDTSFFSEDEIIPLNQYL